MPLEASLLLADIAVTEEYLSLLSCISRQREVFGNKLVVDIDIEELTRQWINKYIDEGPRSRTSPLGRFAAEGRPGNGKTETIG